MVSGYALATAKVAVHVAGGVLRSGKTKKRAAKGDLQRGGWWS